MKKAEPHFTCEICGKSFAQRDTVPAVFVRPAIIDLIRVEHPNWSSDGVICLADLNRYRGVYVQAALEKERGELSDLDADVVRSVQEQETLVRDVNTEFDRELSFGERIADRVAEFGGSWKF